MFFSFGLIVITNEPLELDVWYLVWRWSATYMTAQYLSPEDCSLNIYNYIYLLYTSFGVEYWV